MVDCEMLDRNDSNALPMAAIILKDNALVVQKLVNADVCSSSGRGGCVCPSSMGKNYLAQNPHRVAFFPNNLSKLSSGN
ncbi:hypothetical protein T4D_16137 [Trichinella pseudospiralis]|uniref:Uncharacterized protein n=1 Tax=Trichinella pseudospiralis TaxID=6337 RepID=A0A0V1G2S9_TRIPS|nr:hypothetical protein T4D_16137 [Trichinella pseudospiralis]